MIEIPPAVHIFIRRLAGVQPSPESVWLMGSRANGGATKESDLDFVVFAYAGQQQSRARVRCSTEMKRRKVRWDRARRKYLANRVRESKRNWDAVPGTTCCS